MRPAGLHTHGSDLPEIIGALVVLAAAGAAVEWILSILWVLVVAAGVIVAGLIAAGVWMYRRYGRAPEVLPWRPDSLSQVSREPLAPLRPVQSLPAPQVVNFNFYGLTAGEAAEVVAEQSKAITDRNTP
jgi:heme/copper-type cytochrome/quinol oxidase subunit 2